MKREIKFREWEDGKMHYAPPADCEMDASINGIFEHGIYMQFTGLKDKNGVEIYEGDIVKYSHDWDGWDGTDSSREFKKGKVANRAIFVGKVYWEGEPLAHYVFGPHRICARTDMNLVEVIGNIHENPELLKS